MADFRDIERQLELDRAALARSMHDVRRTNLGSAVKATAMSAAMRHGKTGGAALAKSAARNPLAYAVMGAGLALLIFKQGDGKHDSDADPDEEAQTGLRGPLMAGALGLGAGVLWAVLSRNKASSAKQTATSDSQTPEGGVSGAGVIQFKSHYRNASKRRSRSGAGG